MENQNGQKQVQKSNGILLVTFTIIATAIIIGGGVYVWQQSEFRSMQAKFQGQIVSLQQQINSKQNNQSSGNSSQNLADQPTKQDGQTLNLNYGQSYKVVWTEDIYDPEAKENVPRLKVDQDFINKAPENIKALLALYGYNYGNECGWDGDYTDDRSNLKCILNTALGVGYQCSKVQSALLQKYFPDDKYIMEYACPTVPEGATIEDILNEITLIQTDKNMFKIQYKHTPLNVRELYTDSDNKANGTPINEVDTFQFTDNHFIKLK